MKIKIKANIKEFEKKVSVMQRDLVPSATSRAINQTLQKLQLKQKLFQNKYLDRPKPQTIKGFTPNLPTLSHTAESYGDSELIIKEAIYECLEELSEDATAKSDMATTE